MLAQALLAEAEIGATIVLPGSNGWYDVSNAGVFEELSPAWVPGVTVGVGEDYGLGGWAAVFMDLASYGGHIHEFDAHGAIGKGRLVNPSYRFTVMKTENEGGEVQYAATHVTFSCLISDLYDFNREDVGIAACAASVQLGYAAGRPGGYSQYGKIYMHEVEVLKDYDWPFSTYSYSMPLNGE